MVCGSTCAGRGTRSPEPVRREGCITDIKAYLGVRLGVARATCHLLACTWCNVAFTALPNQRVQRRVVLVLLCTPMTALVPRLAVARLIAYAFPTFNAPIPSLHRPAYLELCGLKAQFPQVPMAALTVGARVEMGAVGFRLCVA